MSENKEHYSYNIELLLKQKAYLTPHLNNLNDFLGYGLKVLNCSYQSKEIGYFLHKNCTMFNTIKPSRKAVRFSGDFTKIITKKSINKETGKEEYSPDTEKEVHDLITCINLLHHFEPEKQIKILKKLEGLLQKYRGVIVVMGHDEDDGLMIGKHFCPKASKGCERSCLGLKKCDKRSAEKWPVSEFTFRQMYPINHLKDQFNKIGLKLLKSDLIDYSDYFNGAVISRKMRVYELMHLQEVLSK